MKSLFVGALSLSAVFGASFASALETGIDRAHMDASVRVQDDLYEAVNGHWLKTAEIPADRSDYGAFAALDDLSHERLQQMIKEIAAGKNPPGSDAQKIGDLYRSFMDEDRIEKLGLTPLTAEIQAIEALRTTGDVARHLGYLTKLGVQGPLAFEIDVDARASTHHLAVLWQSGTGLPDRDYYIKDEPRYRDARTAYLAYIAKMLSLAGWKEADATVAANAIMEVETRLAHAQRTRVELRDPEKNYNKFEVVKLGGIAPSFPWTDYFQGLDLAALAAINVGQPDFVTAAADVVTTTPVGTWRHYCYFKLLDAYAIGLPAAFRAAHFELHGRVLAGVPRDKPRARKAVELISGNRDMGILGEAVGKLYVESYFPPEAKRRMDLLVANLLAAYDRSINDLTWMGPETKAKAREKLSKYAVKIGYPARWRDYSGMAMSAGDLIGNMKTSSIFHYNFEVQKLGRPVDRGEWHMTPQTVNAYYNPSANEIVFPAAILQPPFFDVNADDAVNYGGIGAVIGHEISHGFDDQGSRYDGDGNLNEWWSENDRAAFEALTKRLVDQYNAYEALPGKYVNGQFTLGENIADLSGLAIAYKAYKISLEGKDAPVLDGLTGDQRFFFGWAQVWRRKYREAEMAKRLVTDPHSPSHFRTNGPVMNSDVFEKAFDIKPGDKMYKAPEERIRIW